MDIQSRKHEFLNHIFNAQITAILNTFNAQITAILNTYCRVWLPLFQAKFLAENIGSQEVKYFIPPWFSHSHT